jgi:hypothetical protein
MNSEKYIGLDVHQATISVAVLDSKGKLPTRKRLIARAVRVSRARFHRAYGA